MFLTGIQEWKERRGGEERRERGVARGQSWQSWGAGSRTWTQQYAKYEHWFLSSADQRMAACICRESRDGTKSSRSIGAPVALPGLSGKISSCSTVTQLQPQPSVGCSAGTSDCPLQRFFRLRYLLRSIPFCW